jgi:hypothetical protein
MTTSHTSRGRRGSAGIEFCLSTFVWVPLLIGLIVVGSSLIRAIQVTQIARDTGNMFAKGVDFSQGGNQDIVFRLANGLDFHRDSGEGVILLSTITFIGANECVAGGRQANPTSCPNMNQSVVTRRIVFGNSAKHTSAFGTPRGGLADAQGYIASSAYLTDTSTRATGFGGLLSLDPGQLAYVAEMYQAAPDLNWGTYMSGSGVYARSIF